MLTTRSLCAILVFAATFAVASAGNPNQEKSRESSPAVMRIKSTPKGLLLREYHRNTMRASPTNSWEVGLSDI